MTGIVVTGASRGIGQALAVALSRPGATLALVGRDADRLQETARACRESGGAAEIVPVDVRDRAALRSSLLAFDGAHPVSLCVANAGLALPSATAMGDDTAYDEIAVNLVGALNTILPLVGPMTARGAGQLALVSSLAAFAPLPDSPGYSASKAGLLSYGLALRERLHATGIRVSVICPGYIDTDLGAVYGGWRPLTLSAELAARRILSGLAENRPVIAFPRRLALAARLSTVVPERWRRFGMSAFRFTSQERR